MESSRSAHHTITGYHYQFDKSLIEILNAPADVTVTLEGIEDIDLAGETIQCKYHSSQKYTPSKVKEPLRQFLIHYAGSSKRHLVYTLYAHFNEGAIPTSYSLCEFKSIIGNHHHHLGLTDADLAAFLAGHLRCVAAVSYDDQHKNVLVDICTTLNCSQLEAQDYFYPNALHEIIRLSRQPVIAARRITKAAFLATINKKCRLFSVWLVQLKGERDYQRHVREALRSTHALSPAKDKHFVLDAGFAEQSGVNGLTVLCVYLVHRFFPLGEALRHAVPPTVVLDASDRELFDLKRALLEKDMRINDGYEHITFRPRLFDNAPVINLVPARNGRPTDKIGDASYVLRLVSMSTYVRVLRSLRKPHVLLATGSELEPALCYATETIHLHAVTSHTMLIPLLDP